MRLNKEHEELDESGIGKCSVPMWMNGSPAGFCDEPAFGFRPPCKQSMNYCINEMQRNDGRYNGYVPALACPAHGGPQKHPASPIAHDDGCDCESCLYEKINSR